MPSCIPSIKSGPVGTNVRKSHKINAVFAVHPTDAGRSHPLSCLPILHFSWRPLSRRRHHTGVDASRSPTHASQSSEDKETAMSTVLKEVLAANQRYVSNFGDKGKLPMPRTVHLESAACLAAFSASRPAPKTVNPVQPRRLASCLAKTGPAPHTRPTNWSFGLSLPAPDGHLVDVPHRHPHRAPARRRSPRLRSFAHHSGARFRRPIGSP